jgi:uncharacterized membrane protein
VHRFRRRAAVATGVGVLFLASWGMLEVGFWTHGRLTDTPIYKRYGNALRAGKTPYRDFAVEYPPGALPAFVAPTYFGAAHYAVAFALLMLACAAGCLVFVALARAPWRAVLFLAVSPMLIGSQMLSRFDFWPALFVAAAVAAFLRDRHAIGWAAISAAIAIKLYALVLVPVFAVWTYRRRGSPVLARGLGVGAVVAAAAFLPFVIAAPDGLWHSMWRQLHRPLQVESTAASVLMTLARPTVVSSYGSQNIVGHGALGDLSTALQLAVLIALWIAFARGPADRDRLLRYAAAAVCAFVALGKVLSPQYLIWLVPLVPLVRARRGLLATGLLTGALIVTQVYFPQRYFPYALDYHLAWVVLVRNVLLFALLAALTLPARAWLRSS